jgi:hypothetical protein
MEARRRLAVVLAPFRFLGWGILSIAGTLLFSALAGAATFGLLGSLLTATLSERGAAAAAGAWSLSALLVLFGAFSAALLGAAIAARRALTRGEAEGRDWLLHVPPEEQKRLLPAVPLERIRTGYDRTLDTMVDLSLGRFQLPALVRRVIRARLRRAPLDELITACERRGVSDVGFAEVRDWLLASGLRFAVGPIDGRLRVWQYLVTGLIGAILIPTVLLALRVNAAQAGATLAGVLALAGVVVLIAGLPRAGQHRHPARWRTGILVVGGGLIVWPLLHSALLPMDLGAVWILVVAVTLGAFKWGADQAFVEADRPG